MYVQRCIKGIAGESNVGLGDGLTWHSAQEIITLRKGIVSNLIRNRGGTTFVQIETELTEQNLNRHLHDYDVYGPASLFISLTAGAVERSKRKRKNFAYRARDTALAFATKNGTRAGALFYCWTLVGLNQAVEVRELAENVRDLHLYRRWSRWQLEGEVTAKVHVPANQIEKVEWWAPSNGLKRPLDTLINGNFVRPEVLTEARSYF